MTATNLPVVLPEHMTAPIAAVLGMHPGMVLQIARTLVVAGGHEIEAQYEHENAAVRWFLLPYAINHGEGWWEAASADLNAMLAKLSTASRDPPSPTSTDHPQK